MSADLDIAKARTAEALAATGTAVQALRKLKGRKFLHLKKRQRTVTIEEVDELRLKVWAVGPVHRGWVHVSALQDNEGESP